MFEKLRKDIEIPEFLAKFEIYEYQYNSNLGSIKKENILPYDFMISLLDSTPEKYEKLIIKFRNKMKDSKNFNHCFNVFKEFN